MSRARSFLIRKQDQPWSGFLVQPRYSTWITPVTLGILWALSLATSLIRPAMELEQVLGRDSKHLIRELRFCWLMTGASLIILMVA